MLNFQSGPRPIFLSLRILRERCCTIRAHSHSRIRDSHPDRQPKAPRMNPRQSPRSKSPLATSCTALAAVALTGFFVGLFTIGCRSFSSLPDPLETPFTSIPITADSAGPEHVLLAQLPTPGWRFTLDATREDLRRRSVFVTLRQPQAGVTYPETPVTQRLATSVSARTPITVYARVVPYEEHQSNPAHSLVFRTQ